ncbi:MAG: hypothetical protein FWF75_08890, partial [Propionibacteriaceae bacterium]|nr:hypothetical protein [Propionibacteriaceae bacterium]
PPYRTGTVVLAALIVLVTAAALRWPHRARQFAEALFRYRYLVGIGVVLVLTVCQISGSSITSYGLFLHDTSGPGSTILFGQARTIRSDEWGVQSPYYLSQVANHFRLMNPFVQTGAGQNMLVSYNAPVWDITAIGKPMTWGYLVLGAAHGLAFSWDFKLVFLLLASFDLCLLLTRRARVLSAAGAVLLVFSPAVQWWFDPHFVDVIFWSFCLVLVVYHSMTSHTLWRQLGFALLLCCCLVGFTLAFYPGLQVPFGMMALVLVVMLLVRDHAMITWRPRLWIILAAAALCALAVLAHGWLVSRDALTDLLGAAYPGVRAFPGGGSQFADLFTSLSSVFYPYTDLGYGDIAQSTTFVHLAPAVLFVAPAIWKRAGRNAGIGKALMALTLAAAAWMYIIFPVLFARLTMLGQVTRAPYVYGLFATLLTIWAVGELVGRPMSGRITALTSALFGVALLLIVANAHGGAATKAGGLLTAIGLVGLLICALRGRRALVVTGFCCVALVGGVAVNPVTVGNASLTNRVVIQQAAAISRAHGDPLFVVDSELPYVSNLLAADGVRTLSATYFYPQSSKWRPIDPHDAFRECDNRYANVTVVIADATSCTNPAPDAINMDVTIQNLDALGVEYVLSRRDLPDLFPGRFVTVFDSANDPDIYQVIG